jgi:Protein phosphatase 2C
LIVRLVANLQDIAPADVMLEVRCDGSWRMACASYRGQQHVEDGLPRQDCFAVSPSDSNVNIAVADGLSSAKWSHLGAQRACEHGIAKLIEMQPQTRKDFQKIFEQIRRERFETESRPNDFATTLQLLRIDEAGCWYARLGDGGCVLIDNGRPKWLGGIDSAPLGVSNLSDPVGLSRLEYERHASPSVHGFAIFSDGLQDLFRNETNILRIIELVRESDYGELVRIINAWLSSDHGKDLKDDKTMLIGSLVRPMQGRRAPLEPGPALQAKGKRSEVVSPSSNRSIRLGEGSFGTIATTLHPVFRAWSYVRESILVLGAISATAVLLLTLVNFPDYGARIGVKRDERELGRTQDAPKPTVDTSLPPSKRVQPIERGKGDIPTVDTTPPPSNNRTTPLPVDEGDTSAPTVDTTTPPSNNQTTPLPMDKGDTSAPTVDTSPSDKQDTSTPMVDTSLPPSKQAQPVPADKQDAAAADALPLAPDKNASPPALKLPRVRDAPKKPTEKLRPAR